MLRDIGEISGMEGMAIVHLDRVRLEVARGLCIIDGIRWGDNMNSTFKRGLMALVATALACTSAMAQYDRHHRGRYIVLFEKPYFQGRSVTIEGPVPQLDAYNFNDKAQSAQVRGAWVLCAAKFFKNDCVTINRDTPQLKQVNMNRRATSVRPLR